MLLLSSGPGLALDLRYATADNLAGVAVYARAVALLAPTAHAAMLRAAARAHAMGLGLRVLDAFRPLDAQWAFWRALPDPRYVADPGSDAAMHPRGAAVDVTLERDGVGLAMGTGFDEMSPRSATGALDLPREALCHRALLLGIMAGAGWAGIESEWWHFEMPELRGLPQLWARDVPGGPM